MPRRGPAPPGSDSDVEAAIPSRPWPGEQPLPPELLADSRGAAYTAACALQESSRENDALCAPWPVPWATLVQAQGHDGSAATLERELDAAMVEPAQRTETGGVPPSQIERACVNELRSRLLMWLQCQPRLASAGDAELALRGDRGLALVLKSLDDFGEEQVHLTAAAKTAARAAAKAAKAAKAAARGAQGAATDAQP